MSSGDIGNRHYAFKCDAMVRLNCWQSEHEGC